MEGLVQQLADKDRQIAELEVAVRDRTVLVDRYLNQLADAKFQLILKGYDAPTPAGEAARDKVLAEGCEASPASKEETLSQVKRERQTLLQRVAELSTQLQEREEADAERLGQLQAELAAAHSSLRQQVFEELGGPQVQFQLSQQLLSQQLGGGSFEEDFEEDPVGRTSCGQPARFSAFADCQQQTSQPAPESPAGRQHRSFYHTEIDRLKHVLQEAEQESSSLADQVRLLQTQTEQLRAQRQRSEEAAQRLLEQFGQMEQEYRRQQQRLRALEEQSQQSEREHGRLGEEVEELRREGRHSGEARRELDIAREQLRECHRRFEEKAIALEAYRVDLDSLAAENQQLRLDLDAREAGAAALTAIVNQELGRQGSALEAAEERAREGLEEGREGLVEALHELLGMYQALLLSLDALAGQRAAQAAQEVLARLAAELLPGRSGGGALSVDAFVAELQAAHTQAAAVAAAQQQQLQEGLREQAEEFDREREAWRAKVGVLLDEQREHQALARELADIRATVDENRCRFDALAQEKAATEAALAAEQATRSELAARAAAEAESLVAERDAATRLAAEREAQLGRLRAEGADLASRLRHAEEAVVQRDHAAAEAEQQLQATRSELARQLQLLHAAAAKTIPGPDEPPPTKGTTTPVAAAKRDRSDSEAVLLESSPAKKRREAAKSPVRPVAVPPPVSGPALAVPAAGGRATEQRPIVMLSGFKDGGPPNNRYTNAAKQEAGRVVQQLGGSLCLEHADRFDVRVTHVVSPPSARTLKTLAAAVTGKWIVGLSWVTESCRAGHWVAEAAHGRRGDGERLRNKRVFCSPQFYDGADKVNRMHHARQLVEVYGGGHIVDDLDSADLVFVGSKEARPLYGARHCLTWEEFIDYIYPRGA